MILISTFIFYLSNILPRVFLSQIDFSSAKYLRLLSFSYSFIDAVLTILNISFNRSCEEEVSLLMKKQNHRTLCSFLSYLNLISCQVLIK